MDSVIEFNISEFDVYSFDVNFTVLTIENTIVSGGLNFNNDKFLSHCFMSLNVSSDLILPEASCKVTVGLFNSRNNGLASKLIRLYVDDIQYDYGLTDEEGEISFYIPPVEFNKTKIYTLKTIFEGDGDFYPIESSRDIVSTQFRFLVEEGMLRLMYNSATDVPNFKLEDNHLYVKNEDDEYMISDKLLFINMWIFMEWQDLGQVKGDPGLDGVSLDFIWDGTKLGVKKETDEEYQFVDLQAPSNITESEVQELLANLRIKDIVKIVDELPDTGVENVIYLRAKKDNNSIGFFALQSSLDETNDILENILNDIESNTLLNIICVVESLPDNGIPNTLYFIPTGENQYNIYVYINELWVKLNQNDNLTEYAVNDLIEEKLNERNYNIVDNLPETGLENTLYFVK